MGKTDMKSRNEKNEHADTAPVVACRRVKRDDAMSRRESKAEPAGHGEVRLDHVLQLQNTAGLEVVGRIAG